MEKINVQSVWIHCNKCFELSVNKRVIFSLLSCSHVLCELCLSKCIGKDGTNYCPICRRKVLTKKICEEMHQTYKMYFDPTPWQNMALIEILAFQLNHFSNFYKGISRAEAYFEKAKEEVRNKIGSTAKLSKMSRELKLEILKLQTKAAEYKNN